MIYIAHSWGNLSPERERERGFRNPFSILSLLGARQRSAATGGLGSNCFLPIVLHLVFSISKLAFGEAHVALELSSRDGFQAAIQYLIVALDDRVAPLHEIAVYRGLISRRGDCRFDINDCSFVFLCGELFRRFILGCRASGGQQYRNDADRD